MKIIIKHIRQLINNIREYDHIDRQITMLRLLTPKRKTYKVRINKEQIELLQTLAYHGITDTKKLEEHTGLESYA